MKPLNNQELFNKVLEHSRQMTEQCTGVDNVCSYRGENNNKCFIGAIIPDHLYRESFENNNAEDLPIIGLLVEYPKFARELQDIHDAYFKNREEKLKEIAIKYNLKFE